MTVNMGEGPAETGSVDANQLNVDAPVADNSNQSGFNPAWNPLLEKLPTQFHNMIAPELQAWDKNVTQMAQKIHSEYEPWKPLIQQQIDPNMAYQSWQAIQNLEANPQQFVQAIIEHYGLQQMLAEQGQQPEVNEGEEELTEFDITQHPEFQRVTGMTEQMAKVLLAQHQQQEDAEFDALVDQDLAAAKQKFGEFDEDVVLMRMAQLGEDAETAVQSYQSMVNNILSKSRNPGASAPIIMGSGGGTPSTATPIGNLSDKDRRNLIAQTLANASANGG